MGNMNILMQSTLFGDSAYFDWCIASHNTVLWTQNRPT